MKYFYSVLCLIALSTCSKSSSTSTYTFEYQFSVNTSAAFFITYVDGNNNIDTVNYTGTSWSKTITTTQSTGFKGAQLIVTDKAAIYITVPPGVQGNAYIYLNGKNVDQQAIAFVDGAASVSLYYPLFN